MKFCQLEIGQGFNASGEVGIKTGNRKARWIFGKRAGLELLTNGNRCVVFVEDVEDEILRIKNDADGINDMDQQVEYDCSVERWRDIPLCAPFQASSWGNIRNSETGKHPNIRTDHAGYKVVSLSTATWRESLLVHVLVAWAFLGDRPEEPNGQTYDVNHKDGDRGNSNINNLEYVTKSFNMKHSYKMNPYWTRNFKDKTNGK